MFELHLPEPKKIVRLHEQPDFPNEDLTEANKEVLLHTMRTEAGIDGVAEKLAKHQQYLYAAAMRGLSSLGYGNLDNQSGLTAFTRGFVSFEAINSLVHKPRLYNAANAIARVSSYLADTTPSQPEPKDELEDELYQMLDDEADKQERQVSLLVQDLANIKLPDQIDKFIQDTEYRRNVILEKLPNTFAVLVNASTAGSESEGDTQARLHGVEINADSIEQIQAKLAGASLALALETAD